MFCTVIFDKYFFISFILDRDEKIRHLRFIKHNTLYLQIFPKFNEHANEIQIKGIKHQTTRIHEAAYIVLMQIDAVFYMS